MGKTDLADLFAMSAVKERQLQEEMDRLTRPAISSSADARQEHEQSMLTMRNCLLSCIAVILEARQLLSDVTSNRQLHCTSSGYDFQHLSTLSLIQSATNPNLAKEMSVLKSVAPQLSADALYAVLHETYCRYSSVQSPTPAIRAQAAASGEGATLHFNSRPFRPVNHLSHPPQPTNRAHMEEAARSTSFDGSSQVRVGEHSDTGRYVTSEAAAIAVSEQSVPQTL